MAIGGDGGVIARNRVESFSINAIVALGLSNRVLDNDVIGGRRGVIFVGGSDNVVSGNDVSGGVVIQPGQTADSTGDGIFSGGLRRNAGARQPRPRNDGDGIEVQSAGARLRDNRAQTNGIFGIRAVPGVVDLGGNSASGNGNPLQCVNVFCQ